MSDVPKIVYERLRAASPEKASPEGVVPKAHPDPDVLTAFAEQALSPAEREGILEHLALCGDCREVVAVALPAEESVTVAEIVAQADDARGVTAQQRNWFAWPALRWGALAAGIVVAGAIILTRSEKPNQSLEARHQVETAILQPPATTAAEPSAPAQADQTNSELASTTVIKTPQKTVASKLSPQLYRRSLDKESTMVADLKTAPAEVAVAGRAAGESAMKKDLVANAAPAVPGAASAPVPSANQAFLVNGAAAAVNTEDALVARKEAAPAVTKAKPALQKNEQVEVTSALVATEQSAITASVSEAPLNGRNVAQLAVIGADWRVEGGALKRSLDNGGTWQELLGAKHRLICFAARGSDIWAGGKAGALFHSADGGANWAPVVASADGRALSADVTRIEARSATEIVLSTSSGESWATLDGGKSWVKK